MSQLEQPTADADLLLPDRSDAGSRRAAWLRAGCVILAVAIYLCLWTAYALNGLTAYGRYRQLDPGVSAQSMGAEFRLVSLVQTTQLTNQSTEEVASPPPNAVWLIARIDVTRRTQEDFFVCTFEVLGPDRRTWEPDSAFVSRDRKSTCAADTPIGQVTPLEVIFQVPERYLGEIAGVAIDDGTSREAIPVLVAAG